MGIEKGFVEAVELANTDFGECELSGCRGHIRYDDEDEEGRRYYYCDKCGETYYECSNCGEIMTEEWMGESELALTDNICKNCMHEGYGA